MTSRPDGSAKYFPTIELRVSEGVVASSPDPPPVYWPGVCPSGLLLVRGGENERSFCRPVREGALGHESEGRKMSGLEAAHCGIPLRGLIDGYDTH
jgi:hypothetical protein